VQTIYPAVSKAPDDSQIPQRNPVLPVDEHFFLSIVLNDSVTDIGQSKGGDESEAQIAFSKKRPTTSHGFSSKDNVKFHFMALATAIGKLLRRRPQGCSSRIGQKVAMGDAQQ
jgi:hypothetical protein